MNTNNRPEKIYTSCVNDDCGEFKRLKLFSTPADGNCLFHAVSLAVAHKYSTNAKLLRDLVVEFMTHNFDALYKLFAFPNVQTFCQHIKTMSMNGTYGEVYELYCMASILNVSIRVLYGTECILFSPNRQLTCRFNNLPESDAYLHLANEHYSVFLPRVV